MSDTDPPRGVGRPRNDDTTPAVLAVVRDLVREKGFEAVSVNMVATAAGVAKQTLYRRWPGKAEIVLDAYLESAGQFDSPAFKGLVPTLAMFLQGLFRHLQADGPAIRNLIAAAQADDEFMARFRSRFVEPRAEHVRAILEQARDASELPADADLDVLTEMVHGAFWYRLLTGKTLDRAYAKLLAEQVGALARG